MSDLAKRRKARRWQPKPKAIIVAFACNNPDNGMFEEKCHGVDFPGDFLELASYFQPRRFRTEGDHIVLSGKRWPVVDYTYGYGNWCWDAYWMVPEVATDFLIWLRARGLFDVDGGWCEVFDWFKGERDLPRGQLAALLCDAQRDWEP